MGTEEKMGTKETKGKIRVPRVKSKMPNPRNAAGVGANVIQRGKMKFAQQGTPNADSVQRRAITSANAERRRRNKEAANPVPITTSLKRTKRKKRKRVLTRTKKKRNSLAHRKRDLLELKRGFRRTIKLLRRLPGCY